MIDNRQLVYKIIPSDQSHVDFLDGLLKSGDERVSCYGNDDDYDYIMMTMIIYVFQFDFWSYPTKPGIEVLIQVSYDNSVHLEAMLGGKGISFSIDIPDLEPLLQAEKAQSRASGFDTRYHRVGEVNECRYMSKAIHVEIDTCRK